MLNQGALNTTALNAPGFEVIDLAGSAALGLDGDTPSLQAITDIAADSATFGLAGSAALVRRQTLSANAITSWSAGTPTPTIQQALAGSGAMALSASAVARRQRSLSSVGSIAWSAAQAAASRLAALASEEPAFIDWTATLTWSPVVELAGSAALGFTGTLVPDAVPLAPETASVGFSTNAPILQSLRILSGSTSMGVAGGDLGAPGITTLLSGDTEIVFGHNVQLSHTRGGVLQQDMNAQSSFGLSASSPALSVDALMTGSAAMHFEVSHAGPLHRVRTIRSSGPNIFRVWGSDNARISNLQLIAAAPAGIELTAADPIMRPVRTMTPDGAELRLSVSEPPLRGLVELVGSATLGLSATAGELTSTNGFAGSASVRFTASAEMADPINLSGQTLVALEVNQPWVRLAERLGGSAALAFEADATMRPAERLSGSAVLGVQADAGALQADRFFVAHPAAIGLLGDNTDVRVAERLGGTAEFGLAASAAEFREAVNLGGSGALALAAVAELDKAENLAGDGQFTFFATADLDQAENLAGAAPIVFSGSSPELGRITLLSGQAAMAFAAEAEVIINPFARAPRVRWLEILARERILAVPARQRVVLFTADDRGIIVEKFEKQPSEVVDYDLDMTKYFAPLGGDEIESASVSVSPAGLELGPGARGDILVFGDPRHLAKVWVGGGTDGETYTVTAMVTTQFGRVEEIDFQVRVKEAS